MDALGPDCSQNLCLPRLRSSPGPIASSSKPHGRAQDTRPEQLLSADGHLQRCLGRTRLDHNTNVLYADTLATHVNLWAGRSYMTLGREQGGMKYGFRLWCTEAWGIGQDGWFYAFGSSLAYKHAVVGVSTFRFEVLLLGFFRCFSVLGFEKVSEWI